MVNFRDTNKQRLIDVSFPKGKRVYLFINTYEINETMGGQDIFRQRIKKLKFS